MGCFGVLSITLISNVCWALLGSHRIYSALWNFDTSDTGLIQVATITKRGDRWRALIRKRGHARCATFAVRKDAQTWADQIEAQIDQLHASGVTQAKGSLGDLIDKYVREIFPLRPWGRSKSADLKRLKKDLGGIAIADLTSLHITRYFQRRREAGTGGVTISAQVGYLITMLRVARTVWHMDTPVQAARDARTALAEIRLIRKSNRRDRRVTDAEIQQLLAHFQAHETDVAMSDIIQFCVASAMRISEVCRLKWHDVDEMHRTVVVCDRKHPSDKLGNDQVVPLLDANGFDAFEIVRRQRSDRQGRVFPFNSKTVSAYFTRAVTALGLRDLHLHDLRHEGISRLFEAGYRIEQVALVSGHRDWAMLKRYTHPRAVDLHRDLPRGRTQAPDGQSPATYPPLRVVA
jgi:integrase